MYAYRITCGADTPKLQSELEKVEVKMFVVKVVVVELEFGEGKENVLIFF